MSKVRIPRVEKKVFRLTDRIKDPFDLTQHMPFRVATAHNMMVLNRDLDIRNQTGLDAREMRILINIGSYMPITSADIAYQSRLESTSVIRAVGVLAKKGYVETHDDPSNKRNKKLVLTKAGEKVYRNLCKQIDDRAKILEKALSKSELKTLFDLLDRVEAETEKHLAEFALSELEAGKDIPADQKELIRWYRKSNES